MFTLGEEHREATWITKAITGASLSASIWLIRKSNGQPWWKYSSSSFSNAHWIRWAVWRESRRRTFAKRNSPCYGPQNKKPSGFRSICSLVMWEARGLDNLASIYQNPATGTRIVRTRKRFSHVQDLKLVCRLWPSAKNWTILCHSRPCPTHAAHYVHVRRKDGEDATRTNVRKNRRTKFYYPRTTQARIRNRKLYRRLVIPRGW